MWRHDRTQAGAHGPRVSRFRASVVATLVITSLMFAVSASPMLNGQSHGNWNVVFDGYGDGLTTIETPNGQLYELVPQAADAGDRTHAALVIDRTTSADFTLRVGMRTLEQLRVGTDPNPWEVAWLVWRLHDAEHFYYLALKPNGWEVGKRDPAYPGGQRFLATGNTPEYPVGEHWNQVRVRASGSKFTVWVDGEKLTEFDDQERPYFSGHIGMYTEDARVQFWDFISGR